MWQPGKEKRDEKRGHYSNSIFYFYFSQFKFLCPSVYYIQSEQIVYLTFHFKLYKSKVFFFSTFKWKPAHTHWLHRAAVCVYVFMHTVRDYFLSDWLCEHQKQIQMCRLLLLSMQLTWAEIIAAVLISRMKTSSSGCSKWASSSTSTISRSRHVTVRHLLFLSRGELVTAMEN